MSATTVKPRTKKNPGGQLEHPASRTQVDGWMRMLAFTKNPQELADHIASTVACGPDPIGLDAHAIRLEADRLIARFETMLDLLDADRPELEAGPAASAKVLTDHYPRLQVAR